MTRHWSPTARPWFTLALLCLVSPAFAGEATFSSADGRTALIELYTSEGCSSCPPAEQWLNGLENDDGLWSDFIPLALHVDYWDYIGWKDRFARSAYSDRQRQYAAEGGARVVYTPGMFVNGEEWLGWRRGQLELGEPDAPGTLSLLLTDDTIAVHFSPTSETNENLRVFVALLGMGLETEVRAGENQGRKLRHDFVALGIHSTSMQQTSAGYKALTVLPGSDIQPKAYALVAWVATDDSLAPIQATGGFLP